MITYEDVYSYAEENDIQIKLFENPRFPTSIIGLSQDCRVIYDMERMIVDLMARDNLERFEALEFVEYNTLRALQYAGEDAPIVLCQKELEW